MFQRINKEINLLEKNKDKILDMWLNYEIVSQTLLKNTLEVQFFKERFASKVFDFAIGVIKAKNKVGDCPVIGVMLMLFKKKHIPLADVFIICVHLKNALLHFSYNNKILDDAMIREIAMLMDYNFNGVIQQYTFLYYNDINQHSATKQIKQQNIQKKHSNTSLNNTKKTSASLYLQEIELDMEIIAELSELESDTIAAIDEEEVITQNSLYESANLFEQYAKVLNMMLEFGELEYTLEVLKNLLLNTDYTALESDDKNMITIYLKAIINDLQSWRVSVFVTQKAEDIHYLDKTLMSSIAQLQITLIPQEDQEVSNDTIEFF